MKECNHSFTVVENNIYNSCSKCNVWINHSDIEVYNLKKQLKEKEEECEKLRDAANQLYLLLSPARKKIIHKDLIELMKEKK